MTSDRWTRLADLAVHGANVQPGQILAVSAELEQGELARAVAAAAYRRGAQFVDIWYFDPRLKRARIQNADPETLEYVPQWYGERMLAHAAAKGARVSLAGPTEPNLLDDLDASLVGKDRLPYLKETGKIVGARSTNWCILPVPAPGLGDARLPRPVRGRGVREAVARARARAPARRARPLGRLGRADGDAERLGPPPGRTPLRRLRAARPGHRADGRHASDAHLVGGRLHDRRRPAPLPEPADRRGLHDPGPRADVGARRLDEAARAARRDDHPRPARPLRGRDGRADRRRRERRGAPRRSSRSTTAPCGSASLRSSTARGGSGRSTPSSTTRCWTRTPPATSRSGTASRSSSRRRTLLASTRAARTSTS